jgi:uncharacterized RDD family membrane protein YckC
MRSALAGGGVDVRHPLGAAARCGLPPAHPERDARVGPPLRGPRLGRTIYTVLFLIAILLVGALPDSRPGDVAIGATLVLELTVGQVAYYVLTQRRHGRTPGKRLVGIRVVDRHGAVPTTRALVKRTIPLLIEYFYVFALIAMMTSEFRQRLGDRWGDTYVVAD